MAEVRFLGKIRQLAGVSREEVKSDTVGQALNRLADGHGREFKQLLFPDGDRQKLNKDVEVLINGRNMAFLEGMNTELKAEDTLTLMYHGIRGFPGG